MPLIYLFLFFFGLAIHPGLVLLALLVWGVKRAGR